MLIFQFSDATELLSSCRLLAQWIIRSAIILLVCGRYKLSRRKLVVEEYFDCISNEPDWSPRHNIAPTQPIPVIRQHPKEPVRKLSLMCWGLIPSWAKTRLSLPE